MIAGRLNYAISVVGNILSIHGPGAVTISIASIQTLYNLILAVLDPFDAILYVCIIVTGGRPNDDSGALFLSLTWQTFW